MIVSQHHHIGVHDLQACDICWMHPVVNALFTPVILAGSDAGLEIDNAYVWRDSIQLLQGLTPKIRGLNWRGNCAAHVFSKLDIDGSIANVMLVEIWRAWMRQDLIDASARHYIPTQEESDRARFIGSAKMGVRRALAHGHLLVVLVRLQFLSRYLNAALQMN